MKTIRSFWTRLCAWAIGALGLGAAVSSCEKVEDIFGGNLCYYGTPTMSFKIKGKVVDADNGTPLKGIQVSRFTFDGPKEVLTDGSGAFTLSGNEFPKDTLYVNVKDIDGEANGSYEDKKALITLKQTEKSKDAWYVGEYESKGVVIRMEKSSK